MPVCRVIFRLDFKRPNFDILEQPGGIMRLLSTGPEKFWSRLTEATQTHTVSATYTSPTRDLQRQITIEPGTINGSLDLLEGFDLGNLEKHESFAQMQAFVSSVNTQYKFGDIARAGFRTFYLNKLGTSGEDVKRGFRALFSQDVIKEVDAKLGSIKDYGISLDGEAEDKLSYRYRAGPYASIEAPKYFHEEVADHFKDNMKFDFICEVDMYEVNFSLGDISFAKWCRPAIGKIRDICRSTENMVKNAMGASK